MAEGQGMIERSIERLHEPGSVTAIDGMPGRQSAAQKGS
jgi:hypothetical protein